MELVHINNAEYLFVVSDGKYLKQFYMSPKLSLYKDWGAVEGEDASIESMAYSDAYDSIFTTFGGVISQFSLLDEKLVRKIETGCDTILAMTVDPKGEFIFASSEDGKLNQWSIQNGS